MTKSFITKIVILFISAITFAQAEKEVEPPFHIKTVTFDQNGQNAIPIFGLNDSFQLQFDDLFGNEANYYYEITHYNYDWKPSDLTRNEYLRGFDGLRIQDYTNSLNTLQLFSHYNLTLPNKNTCLLYTSDAADE
mgnify:CR=1 FL=1